MFWGGIWISCNFIVLSWVYLAFKKPSQRFDERDLLIYKRAVLIAFSLMWVYFVTASVYICWKFGAMGDISANLLLLVVFGGTGGCDAADDHRPGSGEIFTLAAIGLSDCTGFRGGCRRGVSIQRG